MAWVMLGIAGIFEVVWATCMKYSEGFTKLSWSLLTFAGMAVSFFLLARATKTLPLGTAYAVWTGIGALGSVIVGFILFSLRTASTALLCVNSTRKRLSFFASSISTSSIIRIRRKKVSCTASSAK